MEKNKLLTAAFVSVLLLSTATAFQFANLGQANPYIRDWKQAGEIAPPDGTLPPTISILSPENNSVYASNNVSLTLDVTMPESKSVSLDISEIYYVPSWQHETNGQSIKIYAAQGSNTLTNVPEGPRWLEVYAVATARALQNREKQDRLNDFTNELAKARHLLVEITDYSKGGGGPIVCLTFITNIYVIIQNNDVIPVSGLTINVALVNKENSAQIGDTGVITMGRLNAGESTNVTVPVMYNIGSLSLVSSAECVIVLTAGNIILDQLDTRN